MTLVTDFPIYVDVGQDPRPVNDPALFTHLLPDGDTGFTVCLATIDNHPLRERPLAVTADPELVDCQFCRERYARYLDGDHVPDMNAQVGDRYRGRDLETGNTVVGTVVDRWIAVEGTENTGQMLFHLAYVDGHDINYEVTVA
jgi:hypothetical protein